MTPRDPYDEPIVTPWGKPPELNDDDFWDRVNAARDRLKEDPW